MQCPQHTSYHTTKRPTRKEKATGRIFTQRSSQPAVHAHTSTMVFARRHHREGRGQQRGRDSRHPTQAPPFGSLLFLHQFAYCVFYPLFSFFFASSLPLLLPFFRLLFSLASLPPS